MSVKSLDELKRENAETEAVEATEEMETEVVEAEEVEAGEEVTEQVDVESEEAETETSESETELEPWMQSDEQTSQSNGVPVSKHVAMKHKLRGQIKEQGSEIEELRAEIAALKGGQQEQQQPVQPTIEAPKKPTLESCGYDNAKFADALADYTDKMIDYRATVGQQQSQQRQSQEQAKQQLDGAVNSHYDRAEELIEQHGLTREAYQAADTKVRRMIEGVMPGQGNEVTDFLISQLGEGSEKVFYRLGVNNADAIALQSAIAEDKTGMKAMLYLGQLKERLNRPSAIKKTSSAPKPATQVTGTNETLSEKTMRKQVATARKNQDFAKAIRIKREAQKQGIDTKNW